MGSCLFAGSILAVDDLAAGTYETGSMISADLPGAPTIDIQTSSAASTVEESVAGTPDHGEWTFEFYLQPDTDFQQEMEVMRAGQETREFTLTFPEGTNNTWTFDAFVIGTPIVGPYNDVWKMTLTLGIDGDVTVTAV